MDLFSGIRYVTGADAVGVQGAQMNPFCVKISFSWNFFINLINLGYGIYPK